jgi:hypothetical protein
MRRFDKNKNIRKVNLLAEQRYLKSKGLLREDEIIVEPEVEAPTTDNRVPNIPTTDAKNFTIRFNLAKTGDPITGKGIFMTWKVEPNGKTGFLGDDKLDFNPNDLVDKVSSGGVRSNFNPYTFDIEMTNCKLTNRPKVGYEIYKGANKDVIAKIKCSDVRVSLASNSPGSPESEIIYNPKVAPYWRMRAADIFQKVDGKVVDIENEIPPYEEGVVYRAPITPVTMGPKSYMSRFFAIKLGGKLYIKEVKDGPGVDDYKTKGEVFVGVDGETYSNLYTTGNKIYIS